MVHHSKDSNSPHDHEHHTQHHHEKNERCCNHAINDSFISNEQATIPNSSKNQAVYRILNMDCPTEEALIRKKLANISGIESLDFDLIHRILIVHHQSASLEDIEAALNSIDMSPEAIIQQDNYDLDALAPKINWLKLGIAGALALIAEIADFASYPNWCIFILAIIAIILGGFTTYKKGWIALKNFNLNMNALMSFAVTGAMLIGQWPEAAMVMVLFTLAEAIEAKSMDRARQAIKQLLTLTPEHATVQQSDGEWLDLESKLVPIDSIVRVKPGEKIALDGIITVGHSTVNQASITGESLPVEKNVGDQVYAGTLNEAGSFEFRVTAIASQTTLARIIKAVESAQGSKAQTQRFVDNFAKIYTPIVFMIALAIGVIPPLFFNGIWLDWVYKALVLLVIACPCALVISTPVTIVSGLAAATRYGILIKGGMYLEQGRKLVILALDKTGTLTYGKPKQTDFINCSTLPEHEIRQIAVSLSARSDHPVSKALTKAAEQAKITLLDVSDFSAVPGKGIKGLINNQQWYLGNHRLVQDLGYDNQELNKKITTLEEQAKTVVLLINEQGVHGLFAVADTIKETSIEAIQELKKMSIKPMILTGDNSRSSNIIASQLGINEVKSNLLPEDKLNIITTLLPLGVIGMVGDGINDAPALTKANIGFAMGVIGSATAIETADVALMDDDLRKIPQFIRLSKATYAILIQNIVFALVVKMVFFILTFMGETNMWMAVFADIGTSLLVVINGLRLLKKRIL